MPEQAAQRLIHRYHTRNPFELAERLNILVYFKPLGNIYGFYYSLKRTRCIYINSDSSRPMQIFTCAHEVGHDILHQGINTPFLAKHTLVSVDKIEREANRFAVELLLPDEALLHGVTIYQAAAAYNVPEEAAHLKKITSPK